MTSTYTTNSGCITNPRCRTFPSADSLWRFIYSDHTSSEDARYVSAPTESH